MKSYSERQAAEDWLHSKTWRTLGMSTWSRSVMECGQSSAAFGPASTIRKSCAKQTHSQVYAFGGPLSVVEVTRCADRVFPRAFPHERN